MIIALFDPTITWGTLIGVTNLVCFLFACLVTWSVFKTRVEINLQQLQKVAEELKASNTMQAEALIHVADRFALALATHEKHDERMFSEIQARVTDLVGGVQRLVGQNEAAFSRREHDRRKE